MNAFRINMLAVVEFAFHSIQFVFYSQPEQNMKNRNSFI